MVGYKVYFYPKSLEKALRQIDKAKIDLLSKCQIFMVRLAAIGQNEAQWSFGSSIAVTSELITEDDNVIVQIKANGKGVCFLEFGAGSATWSEHPLAGNVPFEVRQGSYSDKNGPGMYTRTGYHYWIFGGKPYQFVMPRRGMYNAYREITQRVYDTAKEVFN